MARQSELDDLRKEVEALRTNQTMVRLGDEADAAFKDISTELHKPVDHDAPRSVMAPEPESVPTPLPVDEWPDSGPVMMPIEPAAEPVVQTKPKPARKAASKSVTAGTGSSAPAPTRAPRKAKPQA